MASPGWLEAEDDRRFDVGLDDLALTAVELRRRLVVGVVLGGEQLEVAHHNRADDQAEADAHPTIPGRHVAPDIPAV